MNLTKSDTGVPPEIAQQIVRLRDPPGTLPGAVPASQSAAVLVQASERVSTGCSGLDKLLKGGVQRGDIVELSGPPGSPKELVVMNVIERFVKFGDQVVVLGEKAKYTLMLVGRILMALQIVRVRRTSGVSLSFPNVSGMGTY